MSFNVGDRYQFYNGHEYYDFIIEKTNEETKEVLIHVEYTNKEKHGDRQWPEVWNIFHLKDEKEKGNLISTDEEHEQVISQNYNI